MSKEKLWKSSGRAEAWFFVRASTPEEAMKKVVEGDYEKIGYDYPEPWCEEIFPADEEELELLTDVK